MLNVKLYKSINQHTEFCKSYLTSFTYNLLCFRWCTFSLMDESNAVVQADKQTIHGAATDEANLNTFGGYAVESSCALGNGEAVEQEKTAAVKCTNNNNDCIKTNLIPCDTTSTKGVKV